MTGDSFAQVLTSLATLVGVIGGIVVQLRGQTEAREGRVILNEKVDVTAAKVDVTAAKVDENTKLTQVTADKVEDVHAATTAIVEASGTTGTTGTHQIMRDDG